MVGFLRLLEHYFNCRNVTEEKLYQILSTHEIWDVRECDICKYTIITPYNSELIYHVGEEHGVEGNFVSVLEKGKPITVKEAIEVFNISGMQWLDEKEFNELKRFLATKKELTQN